MDIMKLTRELGRALQQDQTYINMSVAEQQCNEDEALQNAIGEFNLKRMAINNEAAKGRPQRGTYRAVQQRTARDLRQSDAERAYGGVSGGKERV